ncbi:MAG: MFS transporter [Microbacterium sp.]|nr:MFS transporter [Microbacterium sp.]|tara:strand:+ start:33264 stop:34544 length:1281 start_codon:yes stop_codon:yes gene_type:complete
MSTITSALKSPRAGVWNRSFVAIFLAYFLVNLALNMSNNLSTPYARELGATPVVIGIVATGFTYGAIVFKLASAPAIDSFNRKWVMLGAVGVIFVALVGYAFSTNVPTLITFRVIQGIGQAFTATCFIALAADTLPREKIAAGMGIFALGTAGAMMLGSPIALKLQEVIGYQGTFLVAVGILAGGAIAVASMKVSFTRKKKFRITLTGFIAPEAIPSALLQFLFMLAWSSVFSFLIVFGQDQGLGSNVGFFNTVYGLAVFATAPIGGRLTDRFGYFMLIPMLFFMAAALVTISFASNIWILLLAGLFGALGYGAAGPVVRSITMSVVPNSRRGSASSTLFLASDIGQLVGPIIGGVLATAFGYAVMYQVMPVYLVLALILLLFSHRYLKSKAAAVAAAEKAEQEAIDAQATSASTASSAGDAPVKA